MLARQAYHNRSPLPGLGTGYAEATWAEFLFELYELLFYFYF
jgi:hypothetical protein